MPRLSYGTALLTRTLLLKAEACSPAASLLSRYMALFFFHHHTIEHKTCSYTVDAAAYGFKACTVATKDSDCPTWDTCSQGASGSAIHATQDSIVSISATNFTSNQGPEKSGAIFCDGSKVTLFQVIFSNNTSAY